MKLSLATLLISLILASEKANPHEVLGLTYDATTDQINKRYRELVLAYHPDRNRDDPEAEEKFKAISAAYRELVGGNGGNSVEDTTGYYETALKVLKTVNDMSINQPGCKSIVLYTGEVDEFLGSKTMTKEQLAELLKNAVRTGNRGAVEALLRREDIEPNPNTLNLLIEHGFSDEIFDVLLKDKRAHTAISAEKPALSADRSIINLDAEEKPDLEQLLGQAMTFNRLNIVQNLIRNTDVDLSSDDNELLKWALRREQFELVREILPRLRGLEGNAVIFKCALLSGNSDIVGLLVRDGRVDPTEGFGILQAMLTVSSYSDDDIMGIIDVLLADGRATVGKERVGKMIQASAIYRSARMLQFLLDRFSLLVEIDLEKTVRDAVSRGRPEIVKTLLLHNTNSTFGIRYAFEETLRSGDEEMINLISSMCSLFPEFSLSDRLEAYEAALKYGWKSLGNVMEMVERETASVGSMVERAEGFVLVADVLKKWELFQLQSTQGAAAFVASYEK